MSARRYRTEYDPRTRRYYLVDQEGRRENATYGEGFDSQAEANRWAEEENEWAQRGEQAADPRTGLTAGQEAEQAAEERRAAAEEYQSSGEAQRDRDAGRPPRYGDPQEEYDRTYQSTYDGRTDPDNLYDEDSEATGRVTDSSNPFRRGGGGGGAGGGTSDFDREAADIPIVGWLTGSQARRDAANARSEADRAREDWLSVGDRMPTTDELAVEYGEEDYIGGPERSEMGGAQAEWQGIQGMQTALRQMQDVADDGLTEADRSRMAIARESIGRDVRAQREADQQMLAQRGMSGSGQAVASLMGGQQAGASALSQADSQMQIAAQQRALQAMQSAGALSGDIRGQSFNEDASRRSAIDDFNRWQTEYGRDRERFNTQQGDRTRESRSRARQQSHDNRSGVAAGLTGQWQAASGGARADQARQDQTNRDTAAGLGSLIEDIL
jgi:hypothetical protein